MVQASTMNKIILGDCVEVMKKIPNESIDLIITDPPYGINFKSNMDTKNRFDRIINDDNLDFFEPFIKESFRILKNNTNLYIFCRFDNYPYFYEIIKKNGFKVSNCLIWEKSKALGGLGDMEASYLANYEFIIFAHKGRRILFKNRIGRQFGLIKDESINNPLKLLYPTQKPVSLFKKLITLSSSVGDIVLDPFMGSGTTAVACKQCNRKYLCIDLNPLAIELANKRLCQEVLL